jgi:hypothetical protein
VDLSGVAPSQPLAFDTRMIDAARFHSQDMNANRYFDHTSPNGDGPGDRLTAYGYPWRSYGESIAAGFASTADALQGLIIDAGVPNLGHRHHLLAMDSVFQTQGQVGIGIVLNGSGPYGNYFTIDTAQTNDTRPFLTGVVYNDANNNGKYDIGEGLGGVTVTVAGVGSTVTFGTGGYSLQMSPGTYTVTVSGPGLPAAFTKPVTLGAQNVRLNVTPATVANNAATIASVSAWLAQTYLDVLHRPATQAEITAGTGQILAGVAPTSVAAALRGSAEFTTNNTVWVHNLYRDLLHREAAPAEVNIWLNILRGGMSSQAAVTNIMLKSQAYLQVQWSGWVNDAYQTLFQRPANTAEMNYWLKGFQNGLTRDNMVSGLAGTLAGDTSAAWLTAAFAALLHRTPAANELGYWSGQLLTTPRRLVALQIMQGAEYRRAQGTTLVQNLYQGLLGRAAAAAEVNFWLTQTAVGNGAPPDAVVVALVTCPDYFQRALLTP